MTNEELVTLHRDLCDRALAIIVSKNNDYIGKSADRFANLRACESMFGIPAEVGALVRCLDKLMRLFSFIQSGKLNHESVDDSAVDVINYMVLIIGIIRDRHSGVGPEQTPQSLTVSRPTVDVAEFSQLIEAVEKNEH